jgi:hypothetical protein
METQPQQQLFRRAKIVMLGNIQNLKQFRLLKTAKDVQKGNGAIKLVQQKSPIVPIVTPANMVQFTQVRTPNHRVPIVTPADIWTSWVNLEAKVVKFVQQERINQRKVKRFVYPAHQESITMKMAQLPVKNVLKEDLRQRLQEKNYATIAFKGVINK